MSVPAEACRSGTLQFAIGKLPESLPVYQTMKYNSVHMDAWDKNNHTFHNGKVWLFVGFLFICKADEIVSGKIVELTKFYKIFDF